MTYQIPPILNLVGVSYDNAHILRTEELEAIATSRDILFTLAILVKLGVNLGLLTNVTNDW